MRHGLRPNTMHLSYGEYSGDLSGVNIGLRSEAGFLMAPDLFPMPLGRKRLNLCMDYHEDSTTMTVQRLSTTNRNARLSFGNVVEEEASLEFPASIGESDKHFVFIYLAAKVMRK